MTVSVQFLVRYSVVKVQPWSRLDFKKKKKMTVTVQFLVRYSVVKVRPWSRLDCYGTVSCTVQCSLPVILVKR
jgi:hypothetical protein